MKNNKLRNILLLMALVLAASAPLFCSGLFLPDPGHDLQFHLQRIAGLAQALAAGRFPVQIDPWWISDTGYAVSAFYPDLFLLPSALLVNGGLSLELSYKLLLAAINIVSCLLAFRSFRRISQKESLAWLGTILFVLAPYRLTDLYLRNALGENLAMMFLPLAAESLYTIYHADGSDAGAWRRMGLAYAGICLSHPLSLFMAGLFTLIYVLMQGSKTGQKPVWTALLKGTGLAVLLSLWFLVPLIRFSSSNRLLMDTMYRDVYQEAVYEWQLLEFFSPVRGPSMHLTEGTAGEMPFYLGWSLLIGLIVLIILLARRKASGRAVWQIVLLSLLSMWMCTRLFPYDQLQKNPVTDYFVTKVQYPWRFEMEATLFLGLAAMAAASFLRGRTGKVFRTAVIFLAVLQAGLNLSSLIANATVIHVESASDLDSTNYMGGEFLPADYQNGFLSGDLQPESSGLKISSWQKDGQTITISAANRTGETQTLVLPLTYYAQYHASSDRGLSFPVMDSGDGRVAVAVPAGYSGTVQVSCPIPLSDDLCIAVSLGTLVLLVLFRPRPESLKTR